MTVVIACKIEGLPGSSQFNNIIPMFLYARNPDLNQLVEGSSPSLVTYIWRNQIHQAVQITQAFFQNQQQEITALVEKFATSDMVFGVDIEANGGTTEEASKKVVEISKIHSVSREMEDFFHGFDRKMSRDSVMFLIAMHGRPLECILDFLTFNRKVRIS